MTDREKLIEAMARAVSDTSDCFKPDPCCFGVGCICASQARAALAALEATHVVVSRKPTVEMLTAGTEVFLQVGATEGRASACWQAMIGAAHD